MTTTELEQRVDALDTELFASIESQTNDPDRCALLALHSAVAARLGYFQYLEIGSYQGGSLQIAMRDSRCTQVISIDSRPLIPPDKRSGTWQYPDNSTELMLSRLARLPSVDMSKISTLDYGTGELDPGDLPGRPNYCFIDGEHTDDAALRDARFCALAMRGDGVIAFHDAMVVRPAIRTFLREVWRDVAFAAVLSTGTSVGGGVFAVELGDTGILRMPVVDRAIDSTWHSVMWKVTNRSLHSALPLLAAWQVMPAIDRAVFECRRRIGLAHRRVSSRR